jgi:hypothetical protein
MPEFGGEAAGFNSDGKVIISQTTIWQAPEHYEKYWARIPNRSRRQRAAQDLVTERLTAQEKVLGQGLSQTQ